MILCPATVKTVTLPLLKYFIEPCRDIKMRVTQGAAGHVSTAWHGFSHFETVGFLQLLLQLCSLFLDTRVG